MPTLYAPSDYVRIIRDLLGVVEPLLADREPAATPGCIQEARTVLATADQVVISQAQRGIIARYATVFDRIDPNGERRYHVDCAKHLCMKIVYAGGPYLTWSAFCAELRTQMRDMTPEEIQMHYVAAKLLTPIREPIGAESPEA